MFLCVTHVAIFQNFFEIDHETLIGCTWYKNACSNIIKPYISMFSQKFPKTYVDKNQKCLKMTMYSAIDKAKYMEVCIPK
jgi:hypothetical protein